MEQGSRLQSRRSGGLIHDYIGGGEFYSLALALCMGGVVWCGTAAKAAGGMAWLLIAAALACGLLEVLVFYFWLRVFGAQSFAGSLEYALGRAGGRIMLFAYALFWLLLALVELVYITDLWVALRPADMPLWLYAVFFVLTAAVFAVTGEVALGRAALLVVLPVLLLVLANLLLTVVGSDPRNLLPLTYDGSLLPVALWAAVGIYGDLCVLLPYLEHVAEPNACPRRLVAAGSLAAVLWGGVALGVLIVLGAALPLYDFPILQVFRLAEVGHWFSRFEVIGAVLMEGLALIRLSVLLTAALGGLRSLWGWHTVRRAWLLGVGLAGCLLGLWWWVQNTPPADADMLVCMVELGMALVVPCLVIVGGWLRFRAENRTIVVNKESYGRQKKR